MNQSLLTAALMLLSFSVGAQEHAHLHGKIKNSLADDVKVDVTIPAIKYEPHTYTAALDKNGAFDITFDVAKGFTQVRLTNGDQQTDLIVEPGANLTVTLDAKNFDSTLHYEGKGKEIANFMARYELERPMMELFEIKTQIASRKEPDEFVAELDQLEKRDLEFLEKNGAGLPPRFVDYYKADCRYKKYDALANYPTFHNISKKKELDGNSFKGVSKESYAVINYLKEDFNDDYLDLVSYQSYISSLYPVKLRKAKMESGVPDSTNWTMDSAMVLNYKNFPAKTAEFGIGHKIILDIKYVSVERGEKEYETYKAHFPHSSNLDIIERTITFQKTLATGKPAIDFDITTPEGKKMKLSDLKGNVVLIDFWSRSCVPCVVEMKPAKKIREYFKDKAVSFVYVSVDEDDKQWTDAIKTLEVEGINTRAGDMYESETVKKYGVYGIPSYFLIDKSGKFANADDLARPSDTEKLTAQIENLLK